jgi:hypothetical protein
VTRAETIRRGLADYEAAVGQVGHARGEDLRQAARQHDEALREATVAYEAALRAATEAAAATSEPLDEKGDTASDEGQLEDAEGSRAEATVQPFDQEADSLSNDRVEADASSEDDAPQSLSRPPRPPLSKQPNGRWSRRQVDS